MRVVRYPWRPDVFDEVDHEQIDRVPEAPWYVQWTCTAWTYSGWTPGFVNRVVMPCDELGIANAVAGRVRTLDEARWVEVTPKRPRNRPGRLYVVMVREDAPGLWPTPV